MELRDNGGHPVPKTLPPPGETDEFKAVVASHDLLLHRLSAVVADYVPSGDEPKEWVPNALYLEILQIASAVQELVQRGYAAEALPLTRQMISVALNLAFIVKSDDPRGWAVNYWLDMPRRGIEVIKRELERDRLPKADLRNALLAFEAQIAETAARATIEKWTVPEKRGRYGSFTGLSDEYMAREVGLDDWYEREFSFISNFIHGASVIAFSIAYEAFDGEKAPTIGPQFTPPLPALTLSASAVTTAADLFVGYLMELGEADRRQTLDGAWNDWLTADGAYRSANRPVSLMIAMFDPYLGTRPDATPARWV